MRNWSLLVSLVGALALPQMPSHAFGSSLPQICQGSGQSGASRELGLESKWRDGLSFQGNSGLVVVQKRVSATRSSSYADVLYGAGSGLIRLLRLSAADIHSWEGRLGLIELGGRPVILGTVTEAGMRYVGVALWALVGPGTQPRRVGMVAGYRRVLRRAEMGGGPVWAGEHAPIFTNPRFECQEGEAWLVEEWFVLGQQGVACWKFNEAGDVAPMVVYRTSDDERSYVAGARSATITRIVKSDVGPRARRTRMFEPPEMSGGFPTCDELLVASERRKPFRQIRKSLRQRIAQTFLSRSHPAKPLTT